MASSGAEDRAGCALILAIGLLWLLVSFWPVVLGLAVTLGLLKLLLIGVRAFSLSQRRQTLMLIAAAANRRFAGDVCRLDGGYGVLKTIAIATEGNAADPQALRFCVRLRRLASGQASMPAPEAIPRTEEEELRLVPPAELEPLASMKAFARFLEHGGIGMVGDLSVEARATQAALQCAEERQWATSSLATLGTMISGVQTTLSRATGNELLEPSIPQLRQALEALEAEQRKCMDLQGQSERMLRKLHDFLSVPETVRPILSFNLDGVMDPSRLKDLQASFQEVVTLNEAYRELSRDRLA